MDFSRRGREARYGDGHLTRGDKPRQIDEMGPGVLTPDEVTRYLRAGQRAVREQPVGLADL